MSTNTGLVLPYGKVVTAAVWAKAEDLLVAVRQFPRIPSAKKGSVHPNWCDYDGNDQGQLNQSNVSKKWRRVTKEGLPGPFAQPSRKKRNQKNLAGAGAHQQGHGPWVLGTVF